MNIDYVEIPIIKSMLPATNYKVWLIDFSKKETYVADVICWALIDIVKNGELIETNIQGYMIGNDSNLIPVPNDESFLGYVHKHETGTNFFLEAQTRLSQLEK